MNRRHFITSIGAVLLFAFPRKLFANNNLYFINKNGILCSCSYEMARDLKEVYKIDVKKTFANIYGTEFYIKKSDNNYIIFKTNNKKDPIRRIGVLNKKIGKVSMFKHGYYKDILL